MNLDLFNPFREERGVTLIMVALLILVFIGVAALAIDIGHLFVVRNELQNAADAGCLAGARFLYNDSGTAIPGENKENEDANQIAYQAAVANKSEGSHVEVYRDSGDIERGNWCFATSTFTPNESPQPVDLWDVSPEELDANLDFINAIRVKTRRQDTPAASFFARVFGYENFSLSTEAIAYVGFAGTLAPGEAEQPVAICRESLLVNEKYSCTIGRVISIGTYLSGQETGGWTDFTQDSTCPGTNAQTVSSLVCNGGNPSLVFVHQPIATNPDDISSAFINLRQCWEAATTGRTRPWTLTLPVISCPDYEMGRCQNVVGAVTINIVWITGNDDPQQAPTSMKAIPGMEDMYTNWSFPADPGNTNGEDRWDSFVSHFHLQNMGGTPALYKEKSIYFVPDCNPHAPRGRTGGENFGVLAKIPVLAK